MLRLRRALDVKGITVKGCAAVLGVTEKTMQNKLNGVTDFSYREARMLKDIFREYDIDYLLSDDADAEKGA